MRSEFVKLQDSVWRLNRARLGEARYYRLTRDGTFEQLVTELLEHVYISDHKRQRSDDGKHYRVILKLEVPCEIIDEFHNSAFGYRAQYYQNKNLGERANKFVVDKLVAAILKTNIIWKRTINSAWLRLSLEGLDTKVWIYQGMWLRRKNTGDRNLLVERWQNNKGTNIFNDTDKKIVWGSLTPREEHRLILKGTFITLQGASAEPKKIGRSSELYELGFT